MNEYKITITETLQKTVTVEAESREEAEQKVNDAWRRAEYILDAEDFQGVEIKTEDPYVKLTYREMADLFSKANSKGHKPVCGYIVFTEDSFEKEYSLESRTYRVSSNNKAFISGMGGYSIYGSSLDGSDINVRLEMYMRGENHWKIDYCYMDKHDVESVEKHKSQRDLER